MKNNLRVKNVISTLTMVLSIALLPTLGHAQASQNFDGGTGTWDAGVTQDWDGGTDTWTAGNYANFNSNTVTVSGTVVAAQLNFNGVATTISGGGTIDLNNPLSGGYTSINDNNNPGFSPGQATPNLNPVTISSQISLGNSTGGDFQAFVNDNTGYGNVPNSGSLLTLGNIDFAATSGTTRLQLNGEDNGGTIVLNGDYTTSTSRGGEITFGNNGTGTYTLAPSADFTTFNTGIAAGTAGGSFAMIGDVLNIDTSKFSGNQTMAFYYQPSGNQVNIQGAQNIVLSIYNSQKNSGPDDGDGVSDIGQMHFTQSTADVSHWSGPGGVNQNGSNTTLGAVSGGRLDWDIALQGSSALGLTVNAQAGGVVVLSSNGNNYGLQDGNGILHPSSTVAANLLSGTTLITNTANSAFGNNTGTVNLAAGATLGGTGFATQTVVAAAANSVLTAGDPGQQSAGVHIAPSIGYLTLGGLNASNGLTMDFKLNGGGTQIGVNNDFIQIGTLTLAGTVTINLTALDNPLIGEVYRLFSAGSPVTGTPTFDVIAPTGYELDSSYGNGVGGGYNYIRSTGLFSVELIPEPSTYGLMGLGLLALVAIGRFRRLAA
jgi:hypothetical protein